MPETDTDNPELERLWALSSIENIMQEIRDNGEKDSLRKKVTALGKEYSLVTDYTSMLVISEIEMEELGFRRNNADRVDNERRAQQRRNNQPITNYRVNQNQTNPSGNNGTFNGRRSPGIGTGPVGPAFIMLIMWMKRKKRQI